MDYFDSFWSVYPRKIAKVVAKKYAAKIQADKWPEIMEGLKKQLPKFKQMIAEGRKDFIPHPGTWLNQERWEDEVETIEEIKAESATSIFLKAIQNQNNKTMPDFSPDIKMAFFRMQTPWGQLQKMPLEEITDKFDRAYKNESVPLKKTIDRVCMAANDID